MESFIKATKLIKYTKDYPKTGIEFADISEAVNDAATIKLLKIACANLGVDQDWVVVGIPTRGCLLALSVAFASGIEPKVVQLQKAGIGTLLPNSVELCKSGTIYSDEKKSSFFIDKNSYDAIRKARMVLVCDDVVESGKTMNAVRDAILEISMGARVDGLCFLILPNPNGSIHHHSRVHSLLDKTSEDGVIRPSELLRRRPHLLGTLRGVDSIPKSFRKTTPVAVYGPRSMDEHIVNYVENVPDTFVGLIKWDRFAGGCPNIQYKEYDFPYNILFIYDASQETELQNYMVRELARTCCGSMRIVIPYMPQATMERVDVAGTVATAKSFFDVLCSDLPIVSNGRIVVEVIDIHQTGEMFYVPSNVRFVPTSVLHHLVRDNVPIVAFPDDGAFKRFSHYFRGFTQVICVKTRMGNQRMISVKTTVGPLKIDGNCVTLVDDLTRTGGTLMEAAKALKKLGAREVHVVFVHADFEPGRASTFVACTEIDSITCTDSCPQKAYALKMLNSGKVNIVSVFRFFSSIIGVAFSDVILAVASKDDAKNIAAYNVFNLTCNHHSLKTVHQPSENIRGLLSFQVDSRVPEQPVGDEEGIKGARNRLLSVMHLFNSGIGCVAFESFMRKKADNSYVDTVCAIMNIRCRITTPEFEESAIPPTELAERAISEGKVIGEVLMEEYNLYSKSAWIDCYAPNHQTRVEQLEKALMANYCQMYHDVGFCNGGR